MEIKIVHAENIDDKCFNDIVSLISAYQHEPNLEIEDWQNKPHTLLHLIRKQTRFSSRNGGLILVYEADKLIGISGYNVSTIHPEIWVLGVRTLLHTEYRHKLLMSSLIIPAQLAEIADRAKMAIFLFDEKNHFNLYDIFTQGKLNLFLKNKYNLFGEMWDKLVAVPFAVNIYKGVNQRVLYMLLDNTFTFDWNTIKAV